MTAADYLANGAVKNYLDWILKDKGQCILLKNQYASVLEVKCEEQGKRDLQTPSREDNASIGVE